MLKVNYQVRINNFQDSTRDYINEKLEKIEKLIKDYQLITLKIDQESNVKNSITIYKMEIDLKMPNVYIKVSQKGENLNKITDMIIEPLIKKIKKYNSQKERWSEHKDWKQEQLNEREMVNSYSKSKTTQVQTDYDPTIKRKYYEDDIPIHPSEAVDRMELLGHNSYLFKNIENSRYAMIYKRDNGGYGMIQPPA